MVESALGVVQLEGAKCRVRVRDGLREVKRTRNWGEMELNVECALGVFQLKGGRVHARGSSVKGR